VTIHWCGTGLSSGPGLRALLANGHAVVVWNRTLEKARDVVGDLTSDIRGYDIDALEASLEPGDIAVSMSPLLNVA
jgi:glutamyl-tRNA reductase